MANHSKRYALVDEHGKVVSMIIWDGGMYVPPKGHYLIHAPGIDNGDMFDFEQEAFTKNPSVKQNSVVDQEPTLDSLQKEIESLKQLISEKA